MGGVLFMSTQEKYVIKNCSKNKVEGEYLNNIHVDNGRLNRVNFVDKESPTVLEFTSKSDAETLCERIATRLKIRVEPTLLKR
jgi:hypothetical protein